MKLFETVTPPSKRMEGGPLHALLARRHSTNDHKSLSLTGKVPNRNKNDSYIKPNKFHSKYVCFGGRRTREERKICLKIHLFCSPETLVMRHTTTAARNVVSFSTLIGPFEFERALITRPSTGGKRTSNFITRAPKGCFLAPV